MDVFRGNRTGKTLVRHAQSFCWSGAMSGAMPTAAVGMFRRNPSGKHLMKDVQCVVSDKIWGATGFASADFAPLYWVSKKKCREASKQEFSTMNYPTLFT
jgi:hypothetical protein